MPVPASGGFVTPTRTESAIARSAGVEGDAITLLAKRKYEKLLRKKLSEALRRVLTFEELANKAKLYSEESHTPEHHHQIVIFTLIGDD